MNDQTNFDFNSTHSPFLQKAGQQRDETVLQELSQFLAAEERKSSSDDPSEININKTVTD